MSNSLTINTFGKGPPLVLIHGWGWHSGVWTSLLPVLTPHFQVITVDLPGFGKSSLLSGDYTFDTIATTLLDQLPNSAIWVGWSLGGMFAWWVAKHYPLKISRFVTIAASPKFISDNHWPGVAPSLLETFSASLNSDHQETLQQFLTLQLRGSNKRHSLRTQLLQQCQNSALKALQGGLELLRHLDLRNDLKEINIPSLHLFGANDALVPISVIEKLQPLLIQGRCDIIKQAGHLAFLSNSDGFFAKLCPFIKPTPG